ncbi:MAG TPA: glycosyltransferase family 9 protein [Acidiferrobacter sp.]|nr:glycosyltransferase family 9 protein [Acidiferrobacter sp.]
MTQAPRKVLVVATQRIGDVLLTTPLIRSLHRAWPEARIDVLVFENTGGVLAGNPDVHRVITVPTRGKFWSHLRMLVSLFRRYDLAVTTQTGDRPVLYAWLAGRRRAGLRPPRKKERWKTRLLTYLAPLDGLNTHTVLMNLAIADLLMIPRHHEVVASWNSADEASLGTELPFDSRTQAFVLLHVYPKFPYKMWTRQGWIELADWLHAQGLRIVLSGSNETEELAYVQELAAHLPPDTVNIAGKWNLGQVACLAKRARLYVGPDTALTHIAAALGTPTVALYGPSNPVKWGPWPAHYHDQHNPYSMHGSQQVGNVFLVQGPGECVPCREEGCDRHIRSLSDCLQNLQASTVINAARCMLAASNDSNRVRVPC